MPCRAGDDAHPENWQAWTKTSSLPGLEQPIVLCVARNFNDSAFKENLIVVPALKLALCVVNEAVKEEAFDRAMQLSATAGVFVSSSAQLLLRLKAVSAVADQATSVTLSSIKGMCLGIHTMQLGKQLLDAAKRLARSRMPGLMYVHPQGQALVAAAAAAAAGASGSMAAAAEEAGDAVLYSEDILYWPMGSAIPQRMPPVQYSMAQSASV